MAKKTNITDTEHMQKMRDAAQEAKLREKAEKKSLFIAKLRDEDTASNVQLACKLAGVSRAYMYECRAEDAEFAKQWDDAVRTGRQTLKDMAISVIYDQLKSGDKTVAMFVLRQLEPETWNRDREKTGEGGGPIEHVHKVSPRFAKVMDRLLGAEEEAEQS